MDRSVWVRAVSEYLPPQCIKKVCTEVHVSIPERKGYDYLPSDRQERDPIIYKASSIYVHR